MSIIRRQALRSSVVMLFGFALGGVNILILLPKCLNNLEVSGLTRGLIDAATILSVLATLGTTPVIYKFAPFYRARLKEKENDLPFITGLVCLIGFATICLIGYLAKDFIIRKLGKSPLFAEHFDLVYPFTFLMLAFVWMESFAWTIKRTVESNFLKEFLVRALTSVLIFFVFWKLITVEQFINLFSLLYLIPVIILAIILRRSGQFHFSFRISKVTRRFGKMMFRFGLFVFGAAFLQVASRTMDSIVIIGLKGLELTYVFALATYLASLMELPLRSINSIATPVLSEAWRNKHFKVIFNVYQKSTVTLLVSAVFIFCLVMLSAHNLVAFLGEAYIKVPLIILIMGLAKIIDLGTGVNGQLIATSINWRFDFYTNVLLTLIAFPLNFMLISRFGITGGAVATFISTSIFNLIRFAFIWKKYGWQPYGFAHVKILLVSGLLFIAVYAIPFVGNIYADTVFRSLLFAALFVPAIIKMNVSEEFNSLILQNRLVRRNK